ncbi:CwfJ C-terminus 1-domain-containing protein-like protein, partial [Rhodotorula diobovata]
MSALKVLVTGPAPSLSAYTAKLASLQAKHSFDLVLALDLFAHVTDDDEDLDQLLKGQLKVPVQVYAAQGKGSLPPRLKDRVDRGEELTSNLSVLPKAGLLTLASGLRIATVSGTSPSSPDSPTPFTDAEVSSLISSLTPTAANPSLPPPPPKPVDILLTHLVPASLPLLSSKPLLDDVARAARAKYHFVDAPATFWEREPFEWPRAEGAGAAGERSFCRALSLAEMGNKTKDRWFYAFSITPSSAPSAPATSTPSPFHPRAAASGPCCAARRAPDSTVRPAWSVRTRTDTPLSVRSDHYTCNICGNKGHWIQECPDKEARDAERAAARGGNRAPQKPISPDECWFCLSNPKVTKHLIASIGSETYVTLPKGQLCSTDSSPVPGGGHVLLIPIAHYPTLRSIPSDLAPPVHEEVELYKEALRKCYKSFGAELVAFEVARSSGKGGHAHVQICPIPASLAPEAESTFVSQGAKFGYAFDEVSDPSTFHGRAEQDGKGTEYFKVDLPGGKSLVHWIEPGKGGFSLQFGRCTLALLLHAPDRADWKRCAKPDAEEKKDAQQFKAVFKAFDP